MLASTQIGLTHVPCVRLDVGPNDPRALKVLAADNKIGALADDNDLVLAKILQEINESSVSLLGSGYSDIMLGNLFASAMPLDPTSEWAGMPEFMQEDKGAYRQIIVSFRCEEDVVAFAALLGQKFTAKTRMAWYPELVAETLMGRQYVGDESKA